MRRKPALPLILLMALAIAALAVAGCGGGDSDDSATADGAAANGAAEAGGGSGGGGDGEASEPVATSSLSKAQYVKRANAICTRHRERRVKALDEYREENPEDSEEENFAGSLQSVYVPMMKEEIAELRELGAPKGDEQRIEKTWKSFEKWVEEAEDLEGAEPTKQFNKEVIRAGNLAGNYGMIECTYG